MQYALILNDRIIRRLTQMNASINSSFLKSPKVSKTRRVFAKQQQLFGSEYPLERYRLWSSDPNSPTDWPVGPGNTVEVFGFRQVVWNPDSRVYTEAPVTGYEGNAGYVTVNS